VVTLEQVAAMAVALPDVAEEERHGNRSWTVAGKGFAWERPFSKADLRRFGDAEPPEGPILALRVASLMEKEASLAANPGAFFTIEHFNGYAAVLVQLEVVTKTALRVGIEDAWTACAPASLGGRAASSVRRRSPRARPAR